jgi:hypothetical protein
MPRLYLKMSDLLMDPIMQVGGWAVGTTSMLSEDVVNGLIAAACARLDMATNRRLMLPGITTLSGNVLAGATSIPVTSAVNLDGTPLLALLIGTGGTQEMVMVDSLTITTWRTPIPATVNLIPGTSLTYPHSAGDPVVAYAVEHIQERGSSTSPSDQYFDLTQEGQLAAAHAPRASMGASARYVFLNAFPVQQIYSASIIYPWSNQGNPFPPSDLYIAPSEGYCRFPVGYYVPQDSTIVMTYRGGYGTLPEDLRRAVILEVTGQLALSRNPYGAQSVGSGVRHVSWGTGKRNRANLLSEEASDIAAAYTNLAVA